jgi:hypothetical protein
VVGPDVHETSVTVRGWCKVLTSVSLLHIDPTGSMTLLREMVTP